ncbi:MAG: hypothetical protein ACKESB_02405, partial [Candidatus Hodgkinia cicadicola]
MKSQAHLSWVASVFYPRLMAVGLTQLTRQLGRLMRWCGFRRQRAGWLQMRLSWKLWGREQAEEWVRGGTADGWIGLVCRFLGFKTSVSFCCNIEFESYTNL